MPVTHDDRRTRRAARQHGPWARRHQRVPKAAMNWLLIYTLAAVCLGLLLLAMRRPGGIYAYPFVAGATFLFFVVPQLPALANDPFLPPDAFAKAAVLCVLCAAMCGLGWAVGKRPMIGMSWTFDERRLLWIAAVLSLTGAFFFFKISRLPDELTSMDQWTGLPVAYLFFAKLMTYGFAIAILSFVRRPSLFALTIILYDATYYADRFLSAGRRADTAELFVLIVLGLWFQRGIAVPRVFAVVAIVATALAIPSTGDYRALAKAHDGWPGWSEVSKIDVWRNFDEMFQKGGFEMRNAVHRIHFVDETLNLDYGAWHWNTLVFNYVPAQIVGASFKASLMIPLGERQFSPDYESQIIIGTTHTGMADAFASFWYFGALKFFVVAYLLGRIYRAAAAGNTAYQIVYMISLTPATHVITHETQWIFSLWVYMALLFVPFLALARVKPSFSRFHSPDYPRLGYATPRPLQTHSLPAE
jgi:hypothetical protein